MDVELIRARYDDAVLDSPEVSCVSTGEKCAISFNGQIAVVDELR